MTARKQGTSQASKAKAGTACAKPRGSRASGRGAGARKARISRIRKEIEQGTYETEGKLRIAISRLVDDVLTRRDTDPR